MMLALHGAIQYLVAKNYIEKCFLWDTSVKCATTY